MRNSHLAILLGLAAVLAGCTTTQTADEQELAATMKEHGNELPVASPMISYEPVQPVSGETVVYHTAAGQQIEGWLSRPDNATGDLPALIVIHEWWGLNDNVRRAAERLAGEGYITLAVDLHRGNKAATPKEAMQMSRTLSADKSAAVANLGDAIAYLKTQVGVAKVGVMGWCQGGNWSLQTALNFPADIDAAVVYYGRVSADPEELAVLDMPVLGVFAGNDFIVPPKMAYSFAASMAGMKKDLEFYMYRDVDHAFSNPSGEAYNAEAAADAWVHTTAFLQRNLAADSQP